MILQHAISEPGLLRRALPLLTAAAREGRADPAHAAMLEDRIRFFEGRPQRYGTQLDWDAGGNLSPGEVEEPQTLAERRLAVGLPPLAEHVDEARRRAASEGALPPADYRAYADARDEWAAQARVAPGHEAKPEAVLAISMYSHHNACMPKSITIRNVPEGVRRVLASRAAANGRSLQSYLRAALIELADRPDVGEVLERIRERKALADTRLRSASILRYRDANRG